MEEKEKKIAQLEKETQNPDFWNDQEKATEVSQEISALKEEINEFEFFKKEAKEIEDLNKLAENDEKIIQELDKKIADLEAKINKQEVKTFLSGEYDKSNAILEIFAGAGGLDSQDWATMLLRMYERYCATKGFKTAILQQSFGEGGGPDGRIGTKSVTMEIKGSYAFGLLKKESGVHRLVRISPFNAQKLRQTSFASVNILPEIKEEGIRQLAEEIKPEDLKIDTYKASGPGGQYTNKTESAIRITHIPTGIVVASQTERLQGKNKANAMKILYAKLYQLKEQEHEKKMKEIKGSQVSASFGSQIRSYVLHPYKMVKDLRTQYETSDPEAVLNGDLEGFVEAEIKTPNL